MMNNTWEAIGITEAQYNDAVAPYRIMVFEILKQTAGKVLLTDIKSKEFEDLAGEFNINTHQK